MTGAQGPAHDRGLRVLHVAQPLDAGVPAVVRDLVADQVGRGWEVHVACPPASVLTDQVPAVGGTVHRWDATRDPGPSVLAELRGIARVVRAVDPDVVVLHSAKAGLVGRLALRGRRPTVVVPHAWSFQAASGALAQAVRRWEAFAGRWTTIVVCVSEAERARGAAAGVRAPMTVVDNGVDLTRADQRSAPEARAALGLLERPTVVCVGRLSEQKGQDLLVDAWPQVTAAVPEAHLLLVGDGPLRGRLESLADDGVTLTGSRSDVPTLLAAADVVVMPSRWEGAALVTVEAMAAGRPVVGTAVDGMATTLGATGRVVPIGDPHALAEAVTGYLLDPARARADGLAARRRVEQHFDARATRDAWHQLLLEVARPPAVS